MLERWVEVGKTLIEREGGSPSGGKADSSPLKRFGMTADLACG